VGRVSHVRRVVERGILESIGEPTRRLLEQGKGGKSKFIGYKGIRGPTLGKGGLAITVLRR
jgi:hypothetical protein